jgi:hypothetical protein
MAILSSIHLCIYNLQHLSLEIDTPSYLIIMMKTVKQRFLSNKYIDNMKYIAFNYIDSDTDNDKEWTVLSLQVMQS